MGGAKGTKAKGGKEWGGKARKNETKKGKGNAKAKAIKDSAAG